MPMTEPTEPTDRHRRIRSFVLRQGRITPAQERAFADHWAHYGLDYTGAPRDYAQVFGNAQPLVLEIGFGNGEQLAWGAAHEPHKNFIGVEVHRPGVGRVLNALGAQNSTNTRVYHHDAVEVLINEIAPGALSEVRIYFPDPWHKKRHNKRRLIQPELTALLATRVKPGGCLHLATDWADYAEQMLAVVDADATWRNRAGAGQYSPRPEWRTQTHFEKRGVRLGHGVWDLLFDRA